MTYDSNFQQTSLKILPFHGDPGLHTLINQRIRSLSQTFSRNEPKNLFVERPSFTQQSRTSSTSQSVACLEKLSESSKEPHVSIQLVAEEGANAYNEHPKKPGRWERLVEEYRKNYCPRRPPPLVLPTPPTDIEKYSFVKMRRPFLVTCDVIALLAVSYGAWRFALACPLFAWFTVYVTIQEIHLVAALFIIILGKELNLKAHGSILKNHPLIGDDLPTVDIYLPVCQEPLEVMENTWRNVQALQYPAGKLSVFVLDDGADNTVRLLANRFEFNYLCRPDRPNLKKAGNLRHAFTQTSGDFFVIFDADFCPRSDFLAETMPYLLADEKRAIVQTPQFFRSLGDQTWIEQGAGAWHEHTYRIMQPCRDLWGAAICVGSNAVYRRAAFEPIGGIVAIDCSEDIFTGFYAVTHGWALKYLPLNLACGICPDTPSAFFSQQMRWCHGTMSLLTRGSFWKGDTKLKLKLCYMTGGMYYIMAAIDPFLYPILAPLILLTRPDLLKYYNLFFAFPSIIIGFVGRKIWARGRYTFTVPYSERVLVFACFQAIWDMIAGNRLNWKPSGGVTGAQKNRRYRNMRILAWGWTITHNSVLIGVAVWRVLGGLGWYNLVPVVVINLISLLWLHRFLMYQHPKE